MKKTLLIIAIVLCIAVAGAAIAVTWNDASNVTGTLTADSYLELSLDNCSTTAISLTEGSYSYYTIQCDVSKSANAGDNDCTLTVTLADTSESVTLDAVTISVYSDSNYQTLVSNGTRKGAGAITVTGIQATSTYYVKLSLDTGLNEAQTAAVGGTMTLSFAKAA